MNKTTNKSYPTVLAAIRAAADLYGTGAYRQLSLAIPLDRYPEVAAYIKKHGRDELVRRVLCLAAEAK